MLSQTKLPCQSLPPSSVMTDDDIHLVRHGYELLGFCTQTEAVQAFKLSQNGLAISKC